MSDGRRIAVIGSNSFSGSDFIDLLLNDERNNVIGLSRSPEKNLIFLPYILRQFRKTFHGLYFLGPVPTPDPTLPLLITPNHSTWWDGFFFYTLNKRIFRRKGYLMMLEEQLSKYRFFRRIGAFGIEPGLRRKSYQALI